MFKLPLFPLNTVLFPGMPLALHVFEERYKTMMQAILADHGPFGVVLIHHGDEAGGPLAEPHAIGCTARVVQVEALPDGRLNLVAMGDARFQLHGLSRERPYLMGEAELLPMIVGDRATVDRGAQTLRPWLKAYLAMLSKVAAVQYDLDLLPEDPVSLAHLAAYLLDTAAGEKQRLLASDSAADLVTRVVALYRAEIPLLRAMLEQAEPPRFGPFSLS